MAGKVQINLYFMSLGADFPFINHARTATYIWRANGATEDHYALLDAQGYPTRMAAGATEYRAAGTNIYILSDQTDRWVLTWDGSGSVDLGGNPPPGVSWLLASGSNAAGRKEYRFTGGAQP